MKFIQKIWKDIRQGENIDLYLTVVFALAVSGLSLAGQTIDNKIPALTLSILALLAITNLVNRQKFEEMLNQARNTFFKKEFPVEVKTDIQHARELWLVGFNLSRTITTYVRILDEKLLRGDKVKILLLNPESDAAHYCNRTMSYPMKLESFRENIRSTITLLVQMKGSKSKNFELRVIDHPLPFSLYGVDIKQPGGKLYIKLYEYRAKTDGVRFILSSRDDFWYEIYQQQLMSFWEDAQPYLPKE